MAQMIEIKEMGLRIMAELQEAGEENIAALLNTVLDPNGEVTELKVLLQALNDLIQNDAIRIALPQKPTEQTVPQRTMPLSKEDSISTVRRLNTYMHYSVDKNRWTFSQDAHPEVVLTKTGFTAAEKILEERGYQWWHVVN